MANNPWTTEEDLALCESYVEAVCAPQRRRQGGLRRRLMQDVIAHTGTHNRTVDALSSRFRVIRLDCLRFEHIHNEVEYLGGDIDEDEDDTLQIALINYRHQVRRDFKHVSEWEILRLFLVD
ncbi:hypothetical protein Hanom_Chr00s001994g01690631 [Helianthus anomalus]